jgi:hypothetical protein
MINCAQHMYGGCCFIKRSEEIEVAVDLKHACADGGWLEKLE